MITQFRNFSRNLLDSSALAAAALLCVQPVAAQQTAASDEPIENIVVTGETYYRNRLNTVSPTLVYDLPYFERFEPESVGDMLKRVPGVAFSGDVGEYDAPQMRGLPTGFTQVLVNGRRIPGSGTDRSVFVDRLPAQLVERVEIVRSPTPDQDSQGIAGTINIILKNSGTYQGGLVTGGPLLFNDGKVRGKGQAIYAGSTGSMQYIMAAGITQRYVPKLKETTILDDEQELDEFEIEDDVRDTTDLTFNADLSFDVGSDGRFDMGGYYIDTDRTEEQITSVYGFNDGIDESIFRDYKINVGKDNPALDFDEAERELEDINQANWGAYAEINYPLSNRWMVDGAVSFNRFEDDINNATGILEDGVTEVEEREFVVVKDDETKADLAFTFDVTDTHSFKFGAAATYKTRDQNVTAIEIDDGEEEDATEANGVFKVTEDRYDAFLMHTWDATEAATLQYGVRFEHVSTTQSGSGGAAASKRLDVNPSATLRYRFSETDQIRISGAHTLRRPDFDQIVPYAASDEPDDDQFTIGNPLLTPEKAWGFDIGYEKRFTGNDGIAGINFFYRDISDRISLEEIADDVFTFQNIGKAELMGVEFDLSTPLDFIGLPDTGFFFNFTYSDSEETDPFTGEKRQFNLQPDYVYNVGFQHNIPAWGASIGASYQDQNTLLDLDPDEVTFQRRNGFLEVYAEKRFGERFLVRLVGSNLLDQIKIEDHTAYDSVADRIAGNIDEYEIELEEVGPFVALTFTATF